MTNLFLVVIVVVVVCGGCSCLYDFSIIAKQLQITAETASRACRWKILVSGISPVLFACWNNVDTSATVVDAMAAVVAACCCLLLLCVV